MNKTTATISSVEYRANGSIKESENFDEMKFEHIIPDSIGEAFLKLCKPNAKTNFKAKKIDI